MAYVIYDCSTLRHRPMQRVRERRKKYASRFTKYQGSNMISICDLELVGKTLTDGELVVRLSKEYFQEQIIEESQAPELLKSCSIANLVGTRIVDLAISLRLANQSGVKYISGIPFLMVYKFHLS
jgi:uncharacterized protein